MIPYDKQLHLLAGFVISAVISLLCIRVEFTPWTGFLVAAFAGMLKEAWDRTGRGNKDFLDFWWTALGGVAPSLVAELFLV